MQELKVGEDVMGNTVPESCRAAVFSGYGTPMTVEEVQVPRELEDHAILVRTSVATVCGSDAHEWDGSLPRVGEFPTILGHEMVGTIVKIGRGADRDSVGQQLELGDRITWSPGQCGACYYCVIAKQPSICLNHRPFMVNSCRKYPYLTGGFAEYGYVYPTSGRLKIPDSISDEVASASSCAMRTVIHMFEQVGVLGENDTVVVQGAGPVGLFAVAKALAAGPAQVFVVGGPDARIALAAEWGAIPLSLDAMPDPAERLDAVMSATNGRGADVVIEASGAPSAFSEGISIVRPSGRYVIVGQVHKQEVLFNPSLIVTKQLTLVGTRSASIDHYYRALEFIRLNDKRFGWDAMLSNRYPLEKVNEAIQSMMSWAEIKPVITIG